MPEEVIKSRPPLFLFVKHSLIRAKIAALVCCLPGLAYAQGHPPDDHGGGAYQRPRHIPHLNDEQRAEIRFLLDSNRAQLRRAGVLPRHDRMRAAERPEFIWPVRAASFITDYGVDAVSGFVDHDARYPDKLEDYHCGQRTYDLDSGYNHDGLDIFSWPFSWKKMDDDAVHIVAAAAGTIVGKQDGNFDRNCGFGNGDWNAVYIEHADGSIAWYGHLKNGSLTEKTVGAQVAAGEFLGVMGSSGNSTGPHLHLEVYDADGQLIDPFAGVCNTLNVDSWWRSQPEYYESGINALSTGDAAASFPECPGTERPNTRHTFSPGEPAYFTAYYRDQLAGQLSDYEVIRPDGSVYSDWNHASEQSHYSASWWYWGWSSFASNGPLGIWTFAIEYEGQRYETPFYLVDACPVSNRLPRQTLLSNTTLASQGPLTVEPGVTVSSGIALTLLARDSVSLSAPFTAERGSTLRVAVGDKVCD